VGAYGSGPGLSTARATAQALCFASNSFASEL